MTPTHRSHDMTDKETPPFSRGDHVHHRPTGEDWVVLRSGHDGAGGFVEPAGWPPCRARSDDCTLIESAEAMRAAGKRVITDEFGATP